MAPRKRPSSRASTQQDLAPVLSLPVRKHSFCTRDRPGDSVEWNHVASQSLSLTIKPKNYVDHTGPESPKVLISVLNGTQVLDILDVKSLKQKYDLASTAALKEGRSMTEVEMPIFIVHKIPKLAIRYTLETGQIRRIETCFNTDEDFERVLQVFRFFGCPNRSQSCNRLGIRPARPSSNPLQPRPHSSNYQSSQITDATTQDLAKRTPFSGMTLTSIEAQSYGMHNGLPPPFFAPPNHTEHNYMAVPRPNSANLGHGGSFPSGQTSSRSPSHGFRQMDSAGEPSQHLTYSQMRDGYMRPHTSYGADNEPYQSHFSSPSNRQASFSIYQDIRPVTHPIPTSDSDIFAKPALPHSRSVHDSYMRLESSSDTSRMPTCSNTANISNVERHRINHPSALETQGLQSVDEIIPKRNLPFEDGSKRRLSRPSSSSELAPLPVPRYSSQSPQPTAESPPTASKLQDGRPATSGPEYPILTSPPERFIPPSRNPANLSPFSEQTAAGRTESGNTSGVALGPSTAHDQPSSPRSSGSDRRSNRALAALADARLNQRPPAAQPSAQDVLSKLDAGTLDLDMLDQFAAQPEEQRQKQMDTLVTQLIGNEGFVTLTENLFICWQRIGLEEP